MVGAGIAVTTAATASAHTPVVTPDCTGVTINLQNFAPKAGGQTNHVTVTINGTVKVDKDFGASYTRTVSFPNEYREKGNTWAVSWTAYDGQGYSGSAGGTEAACPKPAAPEPQTEHRDVTNLPNCDDLTVTTEHQSRTQIVSWQYDQWAVVWGPWEVDSTTTTKVAPDQCVTKPKPKVEYTEWQDQSWPCGATTTTQTRTKSVTDYTFDYTTKQWVPGTPVTTTETRTRDLLPSEMTTCPAPEKPQPIVVQSEKSSVDCTSKQRVVTTTTTTTDWVLNASKSAWVKAAPVVTTSTASFPTTAQECPTPTTPPTVGGVKVTAPPTVTPIVKGVKHEAAAPAAAPQLAYTGSESTTYGLTGLALLVLGSGLVLVTRKRTIKG
jgi:LPXTG-motif cell wall-anchored protein